MENHKSFAWPQGILFALTALCGSLTLGLILPINPSTIEAQTKPSTNPKIIAAQTQTAQRIEKLKAALLTTWQQEAKAKGFGYFLPTRFQGATIVQAKLSQPEKVIALTFDDGPWAGTTTQVLDILKKNNIKGTFFVVGQNLKEHPEVTKRIVTEGHAIGNHTWHHWYHYMNPQVAAFEIDRTTDQIYQLTGVRTNLFRPPGGMMHNGVAAYARNKKYATIMWSSDSIDYSRPGVSRLINNVMRAASPGGIVLLHDGGGNRSHTVQALPEIINKFRKQGYRFVTIPELLEMQDKDDQKAIASKKK